LQLLPPESLWQAISQSFATTEVGDVIFITIGEICARQRARGDLYVVGDADGCAKIAVLAGTNELERGRIHRLQAGPERRCNGGRGRSRAGPIGTHAITSVVSDCKYIQAVALQKPNHIGWVISVIVGPAIDIDVIRGLTVLCQIGRDVVVERL